MNRDEARTYAAELMEAVNDGGWGEVLQCNLDAETIELLRVLRQINGDVERLEQREKELSDALVTRLMPLEFDDGTEPEPRAENDCAAGDVAISGAHNPEPGGLGLVSTPADPLAGLQIQQRRTA